MKTVIEISDDALLDEARKLAAREGITLDALIVQALERVLTEQSNTVQASGVMPSSFRIFRHILAEPNDAVPFTLRRASFKGEGLQAEFRNASWEKLRDAIYEDRGR